ncbi:hypothetical protein V9L05_20005 [Bernardetia sp. Wsw4-3y2]|uniref:hypothetical protein n=1 Tax=Bernardetia sp. Wsw4-3y2 TaxID=3127471 RepID=UPI0030D16622
MNTIKQAVQKMTDNGNASVESFLAKVTEVDKVNRLCDVQPLEGAELFDVRICAIQLKQTNGFWIVPKVGSHVVVTMLGANSGFVSMFSEVEEIYLQTSETDNGGLIKIEYLMERLNSIEQTVTSALTLIKTHTHPANNVVSPMLAPMQTSAGTTNRNSLENKKVKH